MADSKIADLNWKPIVPNGLWSASMGNLSYEIHMTPLEGGPTYKLTIFGRDVEEIRCDSFEDASRIANQRNIAAHMR